MRTRQVFSLAIMIILILGVAFLPVDQTTAASASKKIIRIAYDVADFVSLDPGGRGGSTVDFAIMDMVYSGLLRFKPGDISIVEPDLAESYKVSNDGMEYIFNLRKGVMTHPFPGYPNGIEYTAEDVVWSYRRAADPKFQSYPVNFQKFIVDVLDKYTVRVRLKEGLTDPTRTTFVNERGGWLLCKKALEVVGEEKHRYSPIGTGAFKVKQRFPGQKVVLEAHDKFFRGKPRINEVEVWFMPELNSRDFALRSGEMDIIKGEQEQKWIEKTRGFKNLAVDVFGGGETYILHINLTKKPLDNPLVRQALAYGISRDEFKATIGADILTPLCSIVPDFLPGGLSCSDLSKEGLSYNVDREKAKDLLKKAGYPNGLDFEMYLSEKQSFRECLESLQAQWRTIGVNLKFNMVDHPTYHAFMLKDVSPFVLYESMRRDADAFLTQFFHSDSTIITGKVPSRNYSHANFADGVIDAARQATGQKQIALWKEAQITLLRNLPAIPLYIKKFSFARNSKVKLGYEPVKSIYYNGLPINELTDIAD